MDIFGFPAGPFQTNCYVATGAMTAEGVATPCVVIDPGFGALNALIPELEKRRWAPEAIILTHGHIDHIRDVAQMAEHYDIPVFIHSDDEFFLHTPQSASAQMGAMFQIDQMKPYETATTFEDGEEVKFAGLAFSVIHAPGHSPGCVMLRTSDGADEVVFSGDVLFNGSIGRTDLPYSDPSAMQKSLVEKVMPLEDDLMILPGHGPTSTIGQEKAANPFLQNLK